MAFIFILAFGVVCYGWGTLLRRYCYGRTQIPAVFDMMLGLAVLAFFGGILNAVQAATRPSLYSLVLGGLLLAAIFGLKSVRSGSVCFSAWVAGFSWRQLAPVLTALLLTGCLCWLTMPSAAFNIADDFMTYLVRPVRMLGTGTLAGNPMDGFGPDGFGAQSYFQGFVLLRLPITHVNGFDAVFCFGLTTLMIVAAARQLNLGCGLALLAVATFVSVNPQCVNVSPLYSGTAMIAGLLWASSFLVKALQSDGSPDLWKCAVPLGLFAASLIALKTTLGFFASLYVAVFLAALLSIARPAQVMRLGCSIAVILLTTLLPWLVVLLTTYGTGPELNNSTNPLAARYPSIWARDIGSLWSTRELLYGGNQINYTFLGALLGATGLVGLGLLFRRRACLGDASWLLATLPAAAAAFPAFLINVHLFDGPTGVRYTCPIFLAVLPLVVTSVAAILQRRVAKVAVDADAPLPPQRLDLRLRARQWAPAALLVTVIVAFAPVTLRRVEQLVQARNQLAFPFDQGYLDHNHYVFSRPVSERWREIQAHTVRGEPLLAWVVAPFQLDFSRNRILTVTEPGLVNPLLQFPAGAPPQELAHFLRAWGVRYVLMDNNRHVSAGVKDLPAAWNARFPLYGKIDAYSTYAREALERLLQQSPILHRSDTLVLFELTDNEKSLPRLMTQRQ